MPCLAQRKGKNSLFTADLRLSPATELTRGWLQARGFLSLLISGRRVSRGVALRLSLPVEGPEGQVQSLLAGVDVVSYPDLAGSLFEGPSLGREVREEREREESL